MLSQKAKQKRAEAIQRWHDQHPAEVAEAKKKYRERNRAKINARSREYRKRNPRAVKSSWLKREYGITIEQYDAMLAQQNGCCAACGSTPDSKVLDVDHCHESGLVRGLLCRACNNALGLLREDPARMNALRDYINNFSRLK